VNVALNLSRTLTCLVQQFFSSPCSVIFPFTLLITASLMSQMLSPTKTTSETPAGQIPQSQPDLQELLGRAKGYHPTGVKEAKQLESKMEWYSARGSCLQAQAGDWQISDGLGNQWTVANEVFLRSYRQRPDGKYEKLGQVRAVQATKHIDVPTWEGSAVANQGDWVLIGPSVRCSPCPGSTSRGLTLSALDRMALYEMTSRASRGKATIKIQAQSLGSKVIAHDGTQDT
jgi:hypothetical protein